MQTISDKFRAALTHSHQIVTRVDAFYQGALTLADIPITDGSVTVDRGSTVRRSLSLTVADPSLLPWDASDPLAVYGQSLVVQRGIRFTDGSTELLQLGTFRIDEPSADVHIGPLTLTGKSSEAAIIDDVFMAPASTIGRGTCVPAMTSLIRETMPAATVVNLTSGSRDQACAVATWDANSSRWDAVTQIATSMQAEIYVDHLDRFVIVDVPNVLNDPVVWEIAEGEGGTLMSASRQMSRASVFNAVVVSGENSSSGTAPVSAVATDNDPNSPTRWDGPYGHVPTTYSSALITSTGQAQVTADSMLPDLIAANISLDIATVPNPALEAGDCLRTVAAGRKQLSIAQSFTVPLTAEGDFPLTLLGGKDDVAS